MSAVIGKVIATEKNPSTIDDFYFWTKKDMVLSPFDVIKVEHINGSKTFGVIEEISHITDAANFLAEFISNDFGETDLPSVTDRIGMNYVRAKIISNNKNYYIPVISGSPVSLAEKEEIQGALGLTKDENSVPCGYIEMYQGNEQSEEVKLPVNLDYRFLIGPEGAHLNISGISGLAAKTSYSMFLLKAIQDKSIDSEDEGIDTSFIIFNVKGKDLLAIDEINDFNGDEKERNDVLASYHDLGMTKTPFKNVHYYFPYSGNGKQNTSLEQSEINKYISRNKAKYYKFEYKYDKENLELLFANLDDPAQTMESIINYIINGQGRFGSVDNWQDFLEEVTKHTQAGYSQSKEITVQSWRKFKRIISKAINNNKMFSQIKNQDSETRLDTALKHIKKNEVHVIDIARLNEEMQSFVFGSVIQSIYDLQLGMESEEENAPKKIVIFVDELNKYASSDSPKNSPILRQVLDIAERGRSLGIVLFGAEQFRSNIHSRVTGNCSTHAYGRTNSIEISKADYKYVPPVYKSMMTRLKPGEYIIQNPMFNSLLNIKFPKPIYKQFKS